MGARFKRQTSALDEQNISKMKIRIFEPLETSAMHKLHLLGCRLVLPDYKFDWCNQYHSLPKKVAILNACTNKYISRRVFC